jgi:Fur family transcriptional regulator, zinc uptake regulator
VHRIETRNAYIGCPQPQHEHDAQYLLCEGCGDAVEIEVGGVRRRIEALAAQHGFSIAAQTIEARGLCSRCQPDASGSPA